MSPIEPDRARELLQRERRRIEEALAELDRTKGSDQDEVDSSADPSQDEAGLLETAEVDDALGRQLRTELEAVALAEGRIEAGTYGLSVESGEPIPVGRLEAIPWAERTAEEQERWEHGRS